MVKFSMKIESNDDALNFEGSYVAELARILRGVAYKVEERQTGGKILDLNGNTVGSWKVR